MRSNFEDLVPGLREQRAKERLNRSIAFAGLAHTLCGVEVRPLTPGSRLKLQLLGNGFAVPGVAPLAGDVFQFLWVLSPRWLPLEGWRRFQSESRQRRLRKHVRALDLEAATREILEFMAAQLQDMPDGSTGDEGMDFAPWVHWAAFDAGFWLNVHGGFTLETFMSTPYLVLQQLFRVWQINNPEYLRGADGRAVRVEPTFTNGSDRIFGQWHAERRDAAGAAIKAAHKTRRQ
jgi:hypothetical protein